MIVSPVTAPLRSQPDPIHDKDSSVEFEKGRNNPGLNFFAKSVKSLLRFHYVLEKALIFTDGEIDVSH